jgi:hypothetical protein
MYVFMACVKEEVRRLKKKKFVFIARTDVSWQVDGFRHTTRLVIA